MVLQHIPVLGRNFVLQSFDVFADELDHFSAVNIDHVVVVFATVQFVDGLAALEVVLDHDTGGLELGQHPVDCGQADIFLVGKQFLVDVLGGEVMGILVFEDLQDAHTGMGHFQPGPAQFFGFLFHSKFPGKRRAGKPLVYHLNLYDPDARRMHKLIRTLGFAMLALSLASCRLVYTPDVQQGNLLDKKNVAQLQPGMTKRQVLVLMGSPSVSSPFDHDRWDYVSTQQHRGGPIKVRTLSLTFNNDTLVRTEGDFFAEDAQELVKDSKKYHANYPVDETKGDKTKTPEEEKKDSGDSGN